MKNIITVLIVSFIVGLSSTLLAGNRASVDVEAEEDFNTVVDDTTKKNKKKLKERFKKAKKNAKRLTGGTEEEGNGESKLTVNEEGTEEKSGERKKK
jgi:hypothetical protein